VKRVSWAAGAFILLAAIAAIVLSPQKRPTVRPGELWSDTGRAAGQTSPAPPATSPGAPRQTIYVIEQVSPIVGADSMLAEALGIESPRGRFTTILPKGKPAPIGRVVTFRTSVADQKEIRLHVLRGLSEVASEDHSLGWVRITDLPAGPRGATHVAVAFQVVDGAIVLAAQNSGDGHSLPIEATEAPPGFTP
jgi:molecular chaperone DnaK (HSP70)